MSGHVVPLKTNMITFGTLVVLTIITVYTAHFVDLGWFNLPLAMIIATAKASVVALWFMHLKYDTKINRSIVLGALVFIALLVFFCSIDVFTRV